MTTPARLAAIAAIYLMSLAAWNILGSVTTQRTEALGHKLNGEVQDLWGQPMAQTDPDVRFHWTTFHEARHDNHTELVADEHERSVSPDESELSAGIGLDQRLKGLLWYSLFNVTFDGRWTFTSPGTMPGQLQVFLKLPDGGMYDDFAFEVDGVDYARQLEVGDRGRGRTLNVTPGQALKIHVHYRTRGMDLFTYHPINSNNLTHFHLAMTTDFDAIDYPTDATSPTQKTPQSGGWLLDWRYNQMLSGRPMGVVMPAHLQPGTLAADLSFSAPVSLLLFFLVLIALAAVRGFDIHPINYFAIAGAFFAFQLLFAYSVDHLSVGWAFAFSSAASIGLVVSYLRLVVGTQFAVREAALAQLVYQVGFAAAHFWEGYTGLTVAVLATLTLFLVMQLTGRLKWSALLSKNPATTAPVTP